MAQFYLFENDGECNWMQNEIEEYYPKYLKEPIDFQGRKVKFYGILEWVFGKKRGVNIEWLNEMNLNYVNSIDDLPVGAGIFTTGYDADLVELEEARKKGIPIIEHPCPWIKQLRKQLQNVNHESHQCVFMIDTDHMVHDCYKSIFPDDLIIIQPDNYIEKIKNNKNEKPLQFLTYATFREKDAVRVIEYINKYYPHKENILDGYKKTLCMWTKQGLLEEIESSIKRKQLDEIWVVCSSEVDRSTMSIINEIRENGSKPVIIKTEQDIPQSIKEDSTIGVLLAPIPLSTKGRNIINIIKERYVT